MDYDLAYLLFPDSSSSSDKAGCETFAPGKSREELPLRASDALSRKAENDRRICSTKPQTHGQETMTTPSSQNVRRSLVGARQMAQSVI